MAVIFLSNRNAAARSGSLAKAMAVSKNRNSQSARHRGRRRYSSRWKEIIVGLTHEPTKKAFVSGAHRATQI